MNVTKNQLQQVLDGVERVAFQTENHAMYYKELLNKANGDVGLAKEMMELEYKVQGKKRSKKQMEMKKNFESFVLTLFWREVLHISSVIDRMEYTKN